MTLGDSYRVHGVKAVVYNPLTIVEAVRGVLAVLQRHGERRVSALGVAAMIVWMQAELAGDTVDNTIELMRVFLDGLQRDPKIPRPKA